MNFIKLLSYPTNIQKEIEKEKKFIASELDEDNYYRKYFIEQFEKLLNLKYDVFFDELYELKTLPELDFVFKYCVSYKTKEYSNLRDKDTKHEPRLKEQFNNARDKFIKLLEKNNQQDEAKFIKKIKYQYEPNYQDMLKAEKVILEKMLIEECKITKYGAKKISKILRHIL